ncbi:MAG: TonB family protein [Bacteroidia bacterium]|nr:TonB family protein [Bacteroidia bacterium]
MKKDQTDEQIYVYTSQMPEFPGGITHLYKFITANLKWPNELCADFTIYTRFVIEKDGSVEKIEIQKGVAGFPEYDQEVIRIIKLLPKFVPAQIEGKPVRCWFQIPVKYKCGQ